MDNAQKSAYPVSLGEKKDGSMIPLPGMVDGGLTKREELAARNYVALLSSGGNVEPELEAYARIAVKGADALLTELEKD